MATNEDDHEDYKTLGMLREESVKLHKALVDVDDLRKRLLARVLEPEMGVESKAAKIASLLEALEPFAKVWEAYLASALDEARPEWVGDYSPENVELVQGRGGKELLTLADMKRAHDILSK